MMQASMILFKKNKSPTVPNIPFSTFIRKNFTVSSNEKHSSKFYSQIEDPLIARNHFSTREFFSKMK